MPDKAPPKRAAPRKAAAKKPPRKKAATPRNKPGSGRPREDTEALKDEIVHWIQQGKTATAFCDQTKKITRQTMAAWLSQDAEFFTRVVNARAIGIDVMLDEALANAREAENMTYRDANGEVRVDTGAVALKKLQVETIQKMAPLYAPTRYGPKLQIVPANDASNDEVITEIQMITRRVRGDDKPA